MVVFQGKVLGVFLRTLLEHFVVVTSNFTKVKLHTPATEPAAVTVQAAHLGTTEQVHGMINSERLAKTCRGTEIPSVHAIIGTFIDTAHRQYAILVTIKVLGIFIQERVGITDGGVDISR